MDALIVSGDIFDTVNPAVSSQRQLYTFLKETCEREPGIDIVMISGNHDSGARLELPAPLLDEKRVPMVNQHPKIFYSIVTIGTESHRSFAPPCPISDTARGLPCRKIN